jgi:hypothetical protein
MDRIRIQRRALKQDILRGQPIKNSSAKSWKTASNELTRNQKRKKCWKKDEITNEMEKMADISSCTTRKLEGTKN